MASHCGNRLIAGCLRASVTRKRSAAICYNSGTNSADCLDDATGSNRGDMRGDLRYWRVTAQLRDTGARQRANTRIYNRLIAQQRNRTRCGQSGLAVGRVGSWYSACRGNRARPGQSHDMSRDDRYGLAASRRQSARAGNRCDMRGDRGCRRGAGQCCPASAREGSLVVGCGCYRDMASRRDPAAIGKGCPIVADRCLRAATGEGDGAGSCKSFLASA